MGAWAGQPNIGGMQPQQQGGSESMPPQPQMPGVGGQGPMPPQPNMPGPMPPQPMPYNPTPVVGMPPQMPEPDYRDYMHKDYINSLYRDELGRGGDEAGMDYWLQQMRNGMSRDQVRKMFDRGEEGQAYNQRPRQDQVSSTMLGWIMDGGGREMPRVGTADLRPINRNELSPEQRQRFNEYMRPGYERNINNLYQQELGRKTGDQAGMDYWRQQFENGMTMDQARQMFDQSEEGQAYDRGPSEYDQLPPPRFANDPRNPHIGKPPMHPEIEDALRLANQPPMPQLMPQPMPQYTPEEWSRTFGPNVFPDPRVIKRDRPQGQGLPQGQNMSQAMGILRSLGVM